MDCRIGDAMIVVLNGILVIIASVLFAKYVIEEKHKGESQEEL